MLHRTREQLLSTIAPEVNEPGKPFRPRYDLYDLWHMPKHFALRNELDELLEQWPAEQARTVALLAVQEAFHAHGAPYWEEEAYSIEVRTNPDEGARWLRELMRRRDPDRAARYAQHQALAEAALIESQS